MGSVVAARKASEIAARVAALGEGARLLGGLQAQRMGPAEAAFGS